MPWSKQKPRGGTTVGGWGWSHQKLRKALLPQAYGQPCARCGRPMLQGQELHLDHSDARTGYLGFSHARCNLRAAAQKARRIQLTKIKYGRDDAHRW
jgi:hypothetical protein